MLVAARPEKLIVRVDRTDPSKNIVRGFKAFGLLLDEHPEWHERVTLLALLDPSRQSIPEYIDYRAALEREADEINRRFGTPGWLPVDLRVEDDFPSSIAAYKQFDVLFVNAVYDGLNLVAKEAPLVNVRDGVLVLSENAGAHEELGEWAVSVNPFDVAGQADALHEALTMADPERARRASAIREHVREHDLSRVARGAARRHRARLAYPAAMTPRSDLSHVDETGGVRMVDVGAKPVQRRRATARAVVRMSAETARRLGSLPKGDALATAQLAGIMAAKRTADLIPLCHPLPLTHADVSLDGRRRAGRDHRDRRDDGPDRRRDGSADRGVGRGADDLRHGKGDRQDDVVLGGADREGQGVNAAVLTVSDRVSRGEADDVSGDTLGALLAADGFAVARRVVPDELSEIASAIEELARAARSC